ncbi:Competence transcription factor [Paraliobacillus sp. PM-2]|uniref:competence protein ComK n=1 Tax=Paraliobacillus sp. PM-2 TaxID=1462524 RepID=UPI00061C6853|nr:competence protein ComK [Paraliobacillus sp. PM-2]CQR46251.1 Competence transcription factor [Paraliobacillus sp. PM-2]
MLIVKQYIIDKNTLAISPATAIEHHAVVLEKTQTIYVKQTPLEIIQYNCIIGGSTFEGRCLAAQQLIKRKQKVPILISEQPRLCVFPTQSPKNFECRWIVANHVCAVTAYEETDSSNLQTTIHFQSIKFHLMESPYQIKQQNLKAFVLHEALRQKTIIPI